MGGVLGGLRQPRDQRGNVSDQRGRSGLRLDGVALQLHQPTGDRFPPGDELRRDRFPQLCSRLVVRWARARLTSPLVDKLGGGDRFAQFHPRQVGLRYAEATRQGRSGQADGLAQPTQQRAQPALPGRALAERRAQLMRAMNSR